MKNLKNNQSRRIIVFVETTEEKKITLQMLKNNPELFIWAEPEDFLAIKIELIETIKDDDTKVLFLRRGCNYTASEEAQNLEVLR